MFESDVANAVAGGLVVLGIILYGVKRQFDSRSFTLLGWKEFCKKYDFERLEMGALGRYDQTKVEIRSEVLQVYVGGRNEGRQKLMFRAVLNESVGFSGYKVEILGQDEIQETSNVPLVITGDPEFDSRIRVHCMDEMEKCYNDARDYFSAAHRRPRWNELIEKYPGVIIGDRHVEFEKKKLVAIGEAYNRWEHIDRIECEDLEDGLFKVVGAGNVVSSI